jgi:hypothetical protein
VSGVVRIRISSIYGRFLIHHFFKSIHFDPWFLRGSGSLSHASPEDILAVKRDLATREVLCLKSPGEKAVHLRIVLQHKRSAIGHAGVVETQTFKWALDAFEAGRMIGIVGHPSFLHTATEEKVIEEIRKSQ